LSTGSADGATAGDGVALIVLITNLLAGW